MVRNESFGNQHRVLYIAGNTTGVSEATELALTSAAAKFEEIWAEDARLSKPIIDRDLIAVAVALKPNFDGSAEDSILAIGQIGEIVRPRPYELFVLKAMSRAMEQRAKGNATDTAPMERLAWLNDDEIYRASSASVNGLHVGFAGGWAHHGRILATEFANSLAKSIDLPALGAVNEPSLLPEAASLQRLDWLNQGQDSGDNTPELAAEREQFNFVLPLIDNYRN